jgi:hypothetical protein
MRGAARKTTPTYARKRISRNLFCHDGRSGGALPAKVSVACLAALDGPGAAEQAVRARAQGSRILRQRGQWPLRLAGSLFGLACCALGLFSIFGGGEQLPDLNRERATGFGIAAIVVGLIALIGSLTGDAHRLWYCMPRRWRAFRADVLDGWDTPKSPASPAVTPADAASERSHDQ